MIKQGMMLELVCSEYVEVRGDMDTIRQRKEDAIRMRGSRPTSPVDINLEDLLDHLKKALMIYPAGSDKDRIMTRIRLNRNRAVHDFLNSSMEAASIIETAIEFCSGLHEASLKLKEKPEPQRGVWTNPFTLKPQKDECYAKEGEEPGQEDFPFTTGGAYIEGGGYYTVDPVAIYLRKWTMPDSEPIA